jgi:hypothetical protein
MAKYLCKLADLKSELRISGSVEDARLTRALATDLVATFSGGDQPDFFGRTLLMLPAWPVIEFAGLSVPVVKSASDRDFASATALVAGTDYYLNAERGLLWRLPSGTPWLIGKATTQVVYQAGYRPPDDAPISGVPAPPDNLVEANLLQAAAEFRRMGEPEARQESLPAGAGTVGYSRDVRLLESVKTLLVGERRL